MSRLIASQSVQGSEEWIVVVGYSRDVLAGKYLEGPCDAKQVKRHGYGFTVCARGAWPFRSRKQAAAKARIVERHMGWGEGVLVVLSRSYEVKLGVV